MTTQLDNAKPFLGWPVSKLKAVLKSYAVGKNEFSEFSKLSQVQLTTGATAALLGEAYIRGLIGIVDDEGRPSEDGGFGLTRAGIAVAASTARKRTPKAGAKRVLDALLAKAQELGQDELTPIRVSRIWVFGSYIDPRRKDVGDLDVVVELDYPDRGGTRDYINRRRYILDNYPGLLPQRFNPFVSSVDQYFADRQLYGARRPGLVSPNDIDTLKSLGCPCALYFDVEKGGVITPEFMPRHPGSPGRSNWILEPLALPELSAATEFHLTPAVVATRQFIGLETLPNIETRRADGEGAVEEVSVLFAETGNPVNVKRQLEFGPDTWYYEVTVDAADPTLETKIGADWSKRRDMAGIFDLIQSDLTRLVAFRQEKGEMVRIVSDVEFCERSKELLGDHGIRRSSRLLRDHPTMGWEALPQGHRWGIDIMCGESGTGFDHPEDMDEGDRWSDFGFPFTEEAYYAWRETLPPDRKDRVAEPSDGGHSP